MKRIRNTVAGLLLGAMALLPLPGCMAPGGGPLGSLASARTCSSRSSSRLRAGFGAGQGHADAKRPESGRQTPVDSLTGFRASVRSGRPWHQVSRPDVREDRDKPKVRA